MYTEITKETLISHANIVKNFLIIKGFDEKQLIEISNILKDNKSVIEEIFWLNAADQFNYPSFDSLRIKPRIVIKGNELKAKTGELIFPQDKPIILVVNNFNSLEKEDQVKYLRALCKKEEGDYFPHLYLHEDSIVILGLGLNDEDPIISYKLDVRKLIY